MRIRSKFKDYYDYVGYLYSSQGGEPNITYVRDTIDNSYSEIKGSVYTFDTVVLKLNGFLPGFPEPVPGDGTDLNGYLSWEEHLKFLWQFKWVSVCGELYLLVRSTRDPLKLSPYKLISENHPTFNKIRVSQDPGSKYSFRKKRPTINDLLGIPSETCKEMSKRINSPVFLIESFGRIRSAYNYDASSKDAISVTIDCNVPKLGELGFPSIISAEQMYQRISMFMAALKDNPDSLPPVEVSDKDRLTQKGFDAKVSFRGRPSK